MAFCCVEGSLGYPACLFAEWSGTLEENDAVMPMTWVLHPPPSNSLF